MKMLKRKLIELALVAAQAFGTNAFAQDDLGQVSDILTSRQTVTYHPNGIIETRSSIADLTQFDDQGSIYLAVGANGYDIEPTTAVAKIGLSGSAVTVSALTDALENRTLYLTFPCTNDSFTHNITRLLAQLKANTAYRGIPHNGSTEDAKAAAHLSIALTAAVTSATNACTVYSASPATPAPLNGR